MYINFNSKDLKRIRTIRHRQDVIKIYLNDGGYECMEITVALFKGLVAKVYEHTNQSSKSKKGEEFIDHLSNYHLLKKECIVWC
jgi:hypothetical protein